MTVAIPKVTFGMPVFRIKAGDTKEPIEYTTVDESQQLVSLVGATSVSFIYRKRTALAATAVTRVATIVDAEAGQVRYSWVAEDTTVAGEYYGEWRVTFSNGSIQTFPIKGFQPYVVEADLG